MPAKKTKKKVTKPKTSTTAKAQDKTSVPTVTPEVTTEPSTAPEVATTQPPTVNTAINQLAPAQPITTVTPPPVVQATQQVTTPPPITQTSQADVLMVNSSVPGEDATPAQTDTDDDIFAEEPSHGNGMKYFLIFLFALIVGAVIVGGYFYLQSQKKPTDQPAETAPEQKEDTVEQNEATDGAAIKEDEESGQESTSDDLTTYSVQILNGSGIAGQAGAVQSILEEAGFQQFETGNADAFDFTDTQVQMKKAVPASVFESIMKSLDTYTVVEAEALDDNADYDIIVTVGQKK